MIVIIANIVVMCMTYDGEPPQYTQQLKDCNYIFITIFLIECISKMYGLGVYPYLYSGANKFDLFLVILSMGDLMMDYFDLRSNKALTIAP